MCTNAVQYLIRNGKVHAVVQMRSNDAWAGYRNDYFWQKWVLERLLEDLNARIPVGYTVGDIHWNVGSLHVYSSQFYLIDHYIKTGECTISKADYFEKYPESSLK
jgi:thymidylate synthase